MARGVDIARAYVQIIPSMEGVEKNLSDTLGGAGEKAGRESGEKSGKSLADALLGQLEQAGGKIAGAGGEAGTAMYDGMLSVMKGAGQAALVAAAAAIAVAIGDQLLEVGESFHEMNSAIIIGTGASGDALKGLEDDAKAIATTVPTSFQNAGDIVQEFNTRMGLSGDVLQEVGGRAASLQNIVGQVDLDSLTGAFNEFGISGEQAADEMDYLFGVSQATGIGFNDLVSTVKNAGPAMQELGFSLNDMADMAGEMDKAGLNSSAIMGSMKKALTSVAESGGDVKQSFHDSVDAIQGFIDAGDDAAAINAAADIFGTRNAAAFVAAVKSGSVNLDQLGQSVLGAGGDIEATEEATMSWSEKWELLGNKVSTALEPLGSAVFEGLAAIIDGLTAAMDALWQASEPLRDTLSQIADSAAQELGPALGPVSDALSWLGENIVPALTVVFQGLAYVVQGVATVIQAAVDVITAVVQAMAWFITGTVQTVQGVVGFIGTAFQTAANTVSGAVQAIVGFVSGLPGQIWGWISSIPGYFQQAFANLGQIASNAMQAIVDAVASLPSRIWDWICSIPDMFANMFSSIHIPQIHFDGELNVFEGKFPHLSLYAAGGFVDRPTAIAGEAGGEFVWPSYRPYIGIYADALVSAMGEPSGGTTTNVYIDGAEVNDDAAVEAAFYGFMQELNRIHRMNGGR